MGAVRVTESSVWSASSIARMHGIVTGARDSYICVYNYDTMELIKEFEAHQDVIGCVCAHHTRPYVLSASCDMLVKIWNWKNDWELITTFQGHAVHVMQVAFNPREANVFASASLDNTVKIWNLGAPVPIAVLDGHLGGVNFVDYFIRGGEPYLVNGSDDFSIKRVWDDEGNFVETLEGHTNNVTAVTAHPDLPIIISGAEDDTIRLWNAQNFGLLHTLAYDLGKVWVIGCKNGSNQVAFGCERGILMARVQRN